MSARSRGTLAEPLAAGEPDLWRALASPWRRRLLDLLREAPATTGTLAGQIPELSRFAVMQHLEVLTSAGVVIAERRCRDRINHINPVPLREWYERWVQPLADTGSAELLALKRQAEAGERSMPGAIEPIRTVRLAFEVMTQQAHRWFPHSFGGDRLRRVVLEPWVSGQHYEDWGDGRGHLYGEITVYDPPVRWATRGRLMAGTIMDTDHQLTEEPEAVVVRVTKVAVGPLSEEEAAGIGEYGDLSGYAPAITKLAAG